MKIYTKTGDEGFSDVLQKRVKKSDKIFDLIGTLDKLNAVLSLGFNFCAKDEVKGEIAGLQRKIVGLNGKIAGFYCRLGQEGVIAIDHGGLCANSFKVEAAG